ncbi:MAG: acyl carrier protein [Burkholderiales bacterium]|nr:acyl carrier protein [Burkholderiales bacterium]
MTFAENSTTEAVRAILQQSLSLGPRAAQLGAESRLLGAIPELDSMAVVNVLTAVEERFGITVEDDELDAQTFATFGALVAFVDSKIQA